MRVSIYEGKFHEEHLHEEQCWSALIICKGLVSTEHNTAIALFEQGRQ